MIFDFFVVHLKKKDACCHAYKKVSGNSKKLRIKYNNDFESSTNNETQVERFRENVGVKFPCVTQLNAILENP
jgi:hypothetical protein